MVAPPSIISSTRSVVANANRIIVRGFNLPVPCPASDAQIRVLAQKVGAIPGGTTTALILGTQYTLQACTPASFEMVLQPGQSWGTPDSVLSVHQLGNSAHAAVPIAHVRPAFLGQIDTTSIDLSNIAAEVSITGTSLALEGMRDDDVLVHLRVVGCGGGPAVMYVPCIVYRVRRPLGTGIPCIPNAHFASIAYMP